MRIDHVGDRLATYRRKRDPTATAEPFGGESAGDGQRRFVIQEHHARSLHWDLRLERDGVLVSWAVPKGLPPDPKVNHLAKHTEDHPLDYLDFEGGIPAGEYGAGRMTIWDRGTYDAEKWRDDEVIVVLHGRRAHGRYVLFRTRGDDWMLHRMDPPDPDWQPMPEVMQPMLAGTGPLPEDDTRWGYEFKWDGVRIIAHVDGGRITLRSRNSLDVSRTYPELRALGETLGATRVILDGEVVAFDANGRPDFATLQGRMKLTDDARVRRAMTEIPVQYLLFDLLYLDGHLTTGLRYAERRELLESLELAGPAWQTPPSYRGDGAAILAASRTQHLEGVVAKRLDSIYQPGRRSDAWRKVKNLGRQEIVVGGWTPGEGRRAGELGALLVGVHDGDVLRYAGKVGTGFTDRTLRELRALLKPLARNDSPFATPVPRADAKDPRWVEPRLVAEVEFAEWTPDGKMRHPSYKGLRDDKDPREVVRE